MALDPFDFKEPFNDSNIRDTFCHFSDPSTFPGDIFILLYIKKFMTFKAFDGEMTQKDTIC